MKKMKKLLVMLLTIMLIAGIWPVQAQAAGSVRISKTQATIYTGRSITLKMYGTNSKVTWKSDKSSVASVTSKGKVTGKKAGTATVSAKVGKTYYKCKVTVKNPYLSKTRITLSTGQNYNLKLTGTPVKKWSSNRKTVATVNSKGMVTAKKAGTAVITCQATNGKSYRCTVTVKAHTHTYTEKTVAPTCKEKGYTIHECAICGHKYKDKYTAALKHNMVVKEVIPATKDKKGYTLYACSMCGKETKKDYTEYNPTPQQVYADLIAMQEKYPEGMTWTNDNYYPGGFGCHAFALLMSDAAFGNLKFQESHTDFDNIRVGDVIRMNNDTHTVIALEVRADTIVVAEGNFNSSIHWGRVISKAEIKASGNYVLTKYPK